MTKDKVTDWFPASIKPVREGVYQRFDPQTKAVVYSRWNGKYWCLNSSEFQLAEKAIIRTSYPDLRWRGLAQDPSLKEGAA
jgi:hypothetical protein